MLDPRTEIAIPLQDLYYKMRRTVGIYGESIDAILKILQYMNKRMGYTDIPLEERITPCDLPHKLFAEYFMEGSEFVDYKDFDDDHEDRIEEYWSISGHTHVLLEIMATRQRMQDLGKFTDEDLGAVDRAIAYICCKAPYHQVPAQIRDSEYEYPEGYLTPEQIDIAKREAKQKDMDDFLARIRGN